MSPEQVRAEPLDVRTDVFSFGVVLYEMATGTLPFVGESSAIVFASILNDAPIPPARLNPGVSAEAARIIDKCLEKDRNLRYQHASDIRTDLQRVKRDTDSGRVTGRAEPAVTTVAGWKMIVAATVALLTLLVAGYFYVHRTPPLTDRDTIVLADFENKTGDPVFDDTLRQGLSVELQQSPFLSLISDRQVQQQLALMGQPKEARLTSEVAQQICERTASAMVLEGSIARLGSQYVLGLRARNCNTGSILDQEQIQAAKREDVLNSLSEIGRRLRTRLGESRATVEQHSTPLADATTPSLEALKAYSTGMKVNVFSGFAAALPFFQRSVEIDPTFAMAYANLGVIMQRRVGAVSSERDESLAIAGSRQRSGKVFHRLYLRSRRDGKPGKGVPNPRVVAADLSSRGKTKRVGFVGRYCRPRDRPIRKSHRDIPKTNRG